MKNRRTLVNLYKEIVLVTLVRIFYSTLFTNNNIKVVIQTNAFLTRVQIKVYFFDNTELYHFIDFSVLLSFFSPSKKKRHRTKRNRALSTKYYIQF